MIIPNLYMFHMLDVASLFVLYLTMQQCPLGVVYYKFLEACMSDHCAAL